MPHDNIRQMSGSDPSTHSKHQFDGKGGNININVAPKKGNPFKDGLK